MTYETPPLHDGPMIPDREDMVDAAAIVIIDKSGMCTIYGRTPPPVVAVVLHDLAHKLLKPVGDADGPTFVPQDITPEDITGGGNG